MSVVFEINGNKFDLSEISGFSFQDRKYIFRPSYVFDNSVIKRLRHCVYSFAGMVPYALLTDDVDISTIPFETKLPNGAFDEEESSVIKESTKEYHSVEIRIVQCLVIVTDTEHCFYGNGIDCENIRKEYKRLQLLMKGEKTDNIAIDALCGAVTTKDNVKRWYKELSYYKKIALFLVPLLVICFICGRFGSMSEQNGDNTSVTQQTDNTTILITTEKPDITTTQQSTTQATVTTTIEPTLAETEMNTEPTVKETVAAIVAATAEPTKAVTEKAKSGITVYITPTGEKYHYSAACAGKNAMERDLDDVNGVYEPCKKCS